VPCQDSLSPPLPLSLPLPIDPLPPAGDLDLFSVLGYPSATSNNNDNNDNNDTHDTHDYFVHDSSPDIDALLAPCHSATSDESTLFAAASSIASPPAPYPLFDTLQHPSHSFAGLDDNSTAGEDFSLDALFETQTRGQATSDYDSNWDPHSTLATPRGAPEDHPPTSGPTTTASAESHSTPSTISPILQQHSDDQRLVTPSHQTAEPPTPASSRKHTPLPTQVPSPAQNGEISDTQPLLHISVDSGHEGVVRILLDSGVDINERDRDGNTALHLAVQMRQDAIVRLLLERGALTDVKDSRGKTPIHLAIYSNFETGLKILLDHDANVKKGV
jgi:hypothetical protein